jgi:uncharacterized membrane protein YraQ (UPF0718 family)
MLDFILEILRQSWNILLDSAVYLLFGFFVAGLIHAYFPRDKIARFFGGRNLRSVVNAGLLGVPLPLCSCSVVPTAISLRKSGASRGSTMAFLISTPETGIDSIGISFALLDPLMTIFRPIAALITAVTAGLGANFLDRNNTAKVSSDEILPTADEERAKDHCGCSDDDCTASLTQNNSHSHRIRQAIKFSFGELLDDLAVWFIIGLGLAALIAVLIPEDFFAGSLGRGIWPMLVMLALGIPLYTCASASTPIAAALILKGLSPGAALVFLLAGPATNIGSLVMLSRYFERRFMALYLATIAVVSLALGALLNLIYSAFHLDVRAALGSGSEFIPFWLEIGAALVLSLFLMRSLIKTRTFPRLWRLLNAKTAAWFSAMFR